MALKILEPSAALTPGCDLWIVTEMEASRWARKIDWYLNFQLRRARTRRSPTWPEALERVLRENEIDPPKVQLGESAPVMVASPDLLPNSKTVLVPSLQSPASLANWAIWAKTCFKIWRDLGRPRARIFLPDGVDSSVFSEAWPEAAKADGVELIS